MNPHIKALGWAFSIILCMTIITAACAIFREWAVLGILFIVTFCGLYFPYLQELKTKEWFEKKRKEKEEEDALKEKK